MQVGLGQYLCSSYRVVQSDVLGFKKGEVDGLGVLPSSHEASGTPSFIMCCDS